MIRILATGFAGLLGLAFGSFLNVCLSRRPAGESVVTPRSHCRNCDHTLAWWENIPLVSWAFLRGRCRGCGAWIGWRYPLVELAVGALWAFAVCSSSGWGPEPDDSPLSLYLAIARVAGSMLFYWLLVALAALDTEHLWLPDRLTLPGTVLGLAFFLLEQAAQKYRGAFYPAQPGLLDEVLWRLLAEVLQRLLAILAAAGLILLIRWLYWLMRRREGIGLGDAKLMALLAAWLGLPGALLAFGVGAVLGALGGVVVLITRRKDAATESLATTKLPLGTFLCIGGVISSLWGQTMISAYLRWAGF
jgi:leader peptidase (prepilin peptidase)/N-methyltransferase